MGRPYKHLRREVQVLKALLDRELPKEPDNLRYVNMYLESLVMAYNDFPSPKQQPASSGRIVESV